MLVINASTSQHRQVWASFKSSMAASRLEILNEGGEWWNLHISSIIISDEIRSCEFVLQASVMTVVDRTSFVQCHCVSHHTTPPMGLLQSSKV